MKKLIREFIMDCPICGKSHTVQEYEDETNVEIKNDEVKYREHYFYCVNANEDEHKFVNGQMMNKNMQNARNAYRIKHGLLTSDEIVEIRKNIIYHKLISQDYLDGATLQLQDMKQKQFRIKHMIPF